MSTDGINQIFGNHTYKSEVKTNQRFLNDFSQNTTASKAKGFDLEELREREEKQKEKLQGNSFNAKSITAKMTGDPQRFGYDNKQSNNKKRIEIATTKNMLAVFNHNK